MKRKSSKPLEIVKTPFTTVGTAAVIGSTAIGLQLRVHDLGSAAIGCRSGVPHLACTHGCALGPRAAWVHPAPVGCGPPQLASGGAFSTATGERES